MAEGPDNKVDLISLFGHKLLAKRQGEIVEVPVSELDGKYVGVYFSAHWCPPCRAFTPILRKTYLMLTALGKPFEMIFVSSDQSSSEFEGYYKDMPWMAVPFGETGFRMGLSRRFGVMGIPTLVILSPEGHILNTNARAAVIKDPEAARFPWEGEEERQAFSLLPIILMVVAAWFIATYLFGNKK
ncbi:Nucleoredoxin [Tetrabaena socialis]|uniref:Nucleoredoxin n=1 Tax=Tetrabaena socialis TaxID=47790 RepID=A0A2J8A9Z9_9CHLO|nr:Nucleoredoxin [Tetrabaena socialis]|eukprot:PNH09357.1 Nucleoredoxin [Tetrabaena socialis]